MGTLISLMFMMMMFAGCVGGGLWILSKSNGGNNVIATWGREFMQGYREGSSTPAGFTASRSPEHVAVVRKESPVVAHTGPGATSEFIKRPGKVTSLVLLFAAFIYVLSPLDIVPDVIPILCHIDDTVILAWATTNMLKAFEVLS